ncbi:putative FAD dependent oxidoreductase domain-containing protein [Seiridium cardinale]|uniref:FAD dependent oxidoreductase domain-containing protein n=1 Tax=Seiridium cardinale TaxID=138064 RepID=A0ABR2Y2L7_9PEZI
MGGGDHLPGLPVANPTTSYWQLPPHRIAEHRTTAELPTTTLFDYVIVGSGITGAAVAYKLFARDPSLSILMLEARTAASGASGRNGGLCRAGWWLNHKYYADAFGEEETLKFEWLEEQNVQDIADFVREHDVDCDFQNVETADCYLTEDAWAKVKEVLDIREELKKRRPDAVPPGVKTVYEGEAASQHIGIPNLVGAVTYPGHTQNPYRLVCRMLELDLEKGLNLQTNTPVLEVAQLHAKDDQVTKWAVKTDRGVVEAKQVILATNAFTNVLHTGLATTGFMWPSRSQVSAIRSGSKIADKPVTRIQVALNDAHSGDYFHWRAPGLEGEGDVLYGGGRFLSPTREKGVTDDSKVNPAIADYLRHAAARYYGAAWGKEGEHVRDWAGITCYTPDTFPLVGEAPGEKGLWMSVGMNGHGMAMAFRSAEALVHMITTGEEPEWFPKPFRLARAWSDSPVDLRAQRVRVDEVSK